MKDNISEQIDKKTYKNNKIAQPKTAYVVLELAHHDDYLSGVDVVGVFMDKHKANRIAKNVTTNGKSDQYNYKGKIYEIIML